MKRPSNITLQALEISAFRRHSEVFLKTKKSMEDINKEIKTAMLGLNSINEEEEDFDTIVKLCYDISSSAKKAKKVKRNESYLKEYTFMLTANMEAGKWYAKRNLLDFLEFGMDYSKKDHDFDSKVLRHTHIFEVCIDRLVNAGKIMTQYSAEYGQIYSLVEDF